MYLRKARTRELRTTAHHGVASVHPIPQGS